MKIAENLSHISCCPDQDLNQAPPEYKSEGLPLRQTSVKQLIESVFWNG
jgi:hypothetical protein